MSVREMQLLRQVGKDLGSEPKITLSARQALVAHVGREHGELGSEVETKPIPVLHAMYGERMTNVMKTWPASTTVSASREQRELGHACLVLPGAVERTRSPPRRAT